MHPSDVCHSPDARSRSLGHPSSPLGPSRAGCKRCGASPGNGFSRQVTVPTPGLIMCPGWPGLRSARTARWMVARTAAIGGVRTKGRKPPDNNGPRCGERGSVLTTPAVWPLVRHGILCRGQTAKATPTTHCCPPLGSRHTYKLATQAEK
jgi:hypothetical protein